MTKRSNKSSPLLASAGGLLAMAGLAGCSGSASPQAPAPPALGSMSAAKIQNEMISAMNSSGSVHVTLHNQNGPQSETYSDDSLTDSGRQVITLSNGARAEVLLINAVGYIKGNSEALSTYFGYPANTAAAYAGRWISFKRGQAGYQQVTAGITVSGVIGELKLGGPLSKLPSARGVDGTEVVRLQGTPPASDEAPAGTKATLEIAGSGRPLPVSSEVVSGSQKLDVTFSDWGEKIQLSAPAGAISSNELLGSGPISA